MFQTIVGNVVAQVERVKVMLAGTMGNNVQEQWQYGPFKVGITTSSTGTTIPTPEYQ